jgi:hypothetical protein
MAVIEKLCPACVMPFTVMFKKRAQKYCSIACCWKGTKGVAFNTQISRASAEKRSASLRGRGDGKSYPKHMGRHEHRVVAERMLGRKLVKGEIVHHADGNKMNNDQSNLLVMTQGEHMREHGLGVKGVTLKHKPWEYRWGEKHGRI